MVSVTEILELKTYLVNDFYGNLRAKQREEQSFYDDTFLVPQVEKPMRVSRTGKGWSIIEKVVGNIITSNPQVLRPDIHEAKENTTLRLLNTGWLPSLQRQSPNPFKESPRKALLRGESWIQLAHNPSWVTGRKQKIGLPVLFLSPDPLIVYADPDETDGIPKRVIVWCQRMPVIVKQMYPEWSNPKGKGQGDKKKELVDWLAYYDDESRYFEADGESVLKGGIQDNIYGFVNFIHTTSGFGGQSSSGEPSDLIVGRLRNCRSLLERYTALTSSIDSRFYLLGSPNFIAETTEDKVIPADAFEAFEFGPGKVNILPYGVRIAKGLDADPSPQMFAYYDRLEKALDWELPEVLSGIPAGTSGRQDINAGQSAMSLYAALAQNVQSQFTTAINKSLEILKKVPTLMPEGIKESEIDGEYYVQLRADTVLDAERQATLGSRLYQQGEIDLMTNLVKYQGKTPDEAKDIVTNKMVDDVTFKNPLWAQMAGMAAAEEMGMEKYLDYVKQQAMNVNQQQTGLQQPQSPTAQTRAMGEVMTPQGHEMIDEALRTKGARRPPQGYSRGGM